MIPSGLTLGAMEIAGPSASPDKGLYLVTVAAVESTTQRLVPSNASPTGSPAATENSTCFSLCHSTTLARSSKPSSLAPTVIAEGVQFTPSYCRTCPAPGNTAAIG